MIGETIDKVIAYDKLYHGSKETVENPKVLSKSSNKDFGIGFYCTEIYQQAYKWAVRGFIEKGIVNEYQFPRETLKNLEVMLFDGMSDEWLNFIASCRNGTKHQYDIVIGPMADDTVFNRVNEYINGTISKEQFWQLCRFKYPTHQICFCTEKSLGYLEFIKAQEVSSNE